MSPDMEGAKTTWSATVISPRPIAFCGVGTCQRIVPVAASSAAQGAAGTQTRVVGIRQTVWYQWKAMKTALFSTACFKVSVNGAVLEQRFQMEQ
jgi:hypothetical protein